MMIKKKPLGSYAHQLWFPSKEWNGQKAFLIGGGPSLTGFDFSVLKGRNTIGCNDAYHLGSEVIKFCVFGDANWWQHNKFKLEKFEGRLVTNAPCLMHLNLPNIHRTRRLRDGIHSGNTLGWNYSTGALAINVAVSLGASDIYLLGYDLTNKGDQSHWHNHNGKKTQEFAFARFTRGFACVRASLPEGVRVFNVTDGSSRLNSFERISFADLYKVLIDGIRVEIKPEVQPILSPATGVDVRSDLAI